MISYWKNTVTIYRRNDFCVIYGKYNHFNKNASGEECIGMYWDHGDDPSFPNSRGKISPMVLEPSLISGFLNMLYSEAQSKNESTDMIEMYAKKFNATIQH